MEQKLFMLLLGCRPEGRHVEQHDVFFGIAPSLKDLVPMIKKFWPEGSKNVHIDAWREVKNVDGFEVRVEGKGGRDRIQGQNPQLFFINLGGYQQDIFSEQHYIMLTVKDDKAAAIRSSKETLFFRQNSFKGANAYSANSHIDDKYGVDVDDIYQIEEALSADQKELYRIELIPAKDLKKEDEIHLGYFKLSLLDK